ncbi:hypothetical protein VULLAG_LOCUS20011 [Vulpes lagopus]
MKCEWKRCVLSFRSLLWLCHACFFLYHRDRCVPGNDCEGQRGSRRGEHAEQSTEPAATDRQRHLILQTSGKALPLQRAATWPHSHPTSSP